MDRIKLNYILFFLLSFLIIFAYTSIFVPKTPKRMPEQKNTQGEISKEGLREERVKNVEETISSLQPQGRLITIKTPLYVGTIDTAGGRIVEWRLLKYKESTDRDSPPVNILKDSPPVFNTNLRLKGIQIPNPIPFEFDGGSEVDFSEGKGEMVLYWRSPEGIEVKKIYEIDPSSYLLGQRFEVKNGTQTPLNGTLYVESYGKIEQNGSGKNNKDFTAMVSDNLERVDKLPKEEIVLKGTTAWFGFADKYFLSSFLPQIGGQTEISLERVEQDGFVRAVFSYPEDVIPVGSTSIHKSNLYLGPMDYEVLRSLGLGLENTIKYGWVGFLARPLLWFLKALDGVFKNYGISIIVITLIIRLLFLPLTVKSMASMKEMQIKMQELKPKMDALKEKYKDDKAKQNAELMKLYTSHGINPLSGLSGCLPLLIQLPVFIALYDVLLYSIELRHSSFLWITDLSEPEHLFDIPGIGIPFRILPLAMGVSWYISQKMTPTAAAPGSDSMIQMKMMEFMPLIFTIMFWGLPSGLILYWTVSNILSIVQQLYVNRRFIAAPKGGIKDADSDRKRRKDGV
ncbi:MAG TPA: membrane protein insertase YidC [Thermodesulfobacteriota bacterium]|nr:membrane protein insertase YidC [Thermodesulfobacteriota bacterium]